MTLRSILPTLTPLRYRWNAWLHPQTARAPRKDGLDHLRIFGVGTTKGPIPLVIGITGHRELVESQRPKLEERVARVLREAGSECRYTPLMLLTTLEGEADRLAARVALKLGVKVAAALRFPTKQARNLVDEASRSDFDQLVSSALVLQVPASDHMRGATPADAEAYVVAKCDLLVALWDGEPGDETAKVVEWQLGGLPSAYTRGRRPLDPAGLGPVRHILCARAGESRPSAVDERLLEPGHRDWQVPPGFEPKPPDSAGKIRHALWLGDFEWPIREQIHGFNRDAVTLRDDLAGTMQKTRSQLLAGLGDIPGPASKKTLETFALADGLAQRLEAERLGAIKRAFVAATAGIILFTLYAHLLHGHPAVLAGYLLCTGYALWQARVAGWYRLEEKYLDYRALAEGLRVQFYWALAGIADPVSEHYLRNQRTELAWIPRAIRSHCVRWGFSGVDVEPARPAVLNWVREVWVRSQLVFLAHRTEILERKKLRLDLALWIMNVLMLGGALFLLLWSMYGSGGHAGDPWLLGIEITSLALLVVFVDSFRAVAEKMRYGAQHQRYASMRNIYKQAEWLFGQVEGDPARMRELLMDLGEYALSENAEWLRIDRDRPLEVPS
ncbi:MAG: hypothetical protein ACJ8GN_03620 [Longimicrobiaceae bacterium]